MDIFKRLQINVPFSEALEQMPMYSKFIKDVITKKRRFEDQDVVTMNSCCSAIIQSTLLKKESDPRKVTLLVTIRSVYVGKGLIDLGSSISLIPLSLVKRLGNIELKSTRMTLQLADKSTTHHIGIMKDLLVKVDKFFFPVDFVVIDMEEDFDTPLILGIPFMKTARMMIDIDDGLMKVRVLDEEVCFNLFEVMKHKNDTNEEKEVEECLKELEALEESSLLEEVVEELKMPIAKEENKLELKMFPSHLKYVFLEKNENKPIIISNALSKGEEEKLLVVLEKNQEAMGWTLSDLKGISPSFVCIIF
ncbi:uncharacterized protein LOC131597720 [Vicia villosa]|uniref:uncharacterized protein LOC131597720 n=1 Tax=Vicia villosa TaxID=3911 RepID=UPI00273C180E|nr:uncharacterized protein LOC131597720 [Vicia villosa]